MLLASRNFETNRIMLLCNKDQSRTTIQKYWIVAHLFHKWFCIFAHLIIIHKPSEIVLSSSHGQLRYNVLSPYTVTFIVHVHVYLYYTYVKTKSDSYPSHVASYVETHLCYYLHMLLQIVFRTVKQC